MSTPAYWRNSRQRLCLEGEICPHCRARLFPPRDLCPECGGPAKTPLRMSGSGSVYSYTTMYAVPEGFEDQAPYVAALVKLSEGPLVAAQLTDVAADEVYIGMPVEMITRVVRVEGEQGLVRYGFKFRPVLQVAAAAAS